MPLLSIFYFSVLYFDSSIYVKNFHLISATIRKHIIFFLRNGFFEVLCIIYSVRRNRRRNENLSIKIKLIRTRTNKDSRTNKQTNKKEKHKQTIGPKKWYLMIKFELYQLQNDLFSPTQNCIGWWRWSWRWIAFVVCLTHERCLTLFPGRTIVRDPHYLESPTRCKQDLNLHRIWTQGFWDEFVQ